MILKSQLTEEEFNTDVEFLIQHAIEPLSVDKIIDKCGFHPFYDRDRVVDAVWKLISQYKANFTPSRLVVKT